MLCRHEILIWADRIMQVLFTTLRVWKGWERINRVRYTLYAIFSHWWRHRITSFAHPVCKSPRWITIDRLWKVRRWPVILVEVHRRLLKWTRLGGSAAFLIDFWFGVLRSVVRNELLHSDNLSCTSLIRSNRSEYSRHAEVLAFDILPLRLPIVTFKDDKAVILSNRWLLVTGIRRAVWRNLIACSLPVGRTIFYGDPNFTRFRIAVFVDDLTFWQLVVSLTGFDTLQMTWIVDVTARKAESPRKMFEVILLIVAWLIICLPLSIIVTIANYDRLRVILGDSDMRNLFITDD